MTRDELEKLAVEAGFAYIEDEGIGWAGNYNASFPKFAELVTQEETLRCVTILLKMHDKAKSQHNYYLHAAGMLARKDGE